jgi:hypothetical protein
MMRASHLDLGDGIVTKVSRAGRLQQIVKVLRENEGAYTSHRLAHMCGMAPSPHFRGLLGELYQAKKINGASVVLRNGMRAYYWSAMPLAQQLDMPLDE